MNYNQLTFHKANPFYKQDFIPNIAWFNRQKKQFPSQIPSGKDYFTDNGRKHFINRFNHSQIEEDSVLKSPERYPYENRIAIDKAYMRSLHTIDIQGATSNTRINQSIKNKYKARDDLARRYNQSMDTGKAKQLTQEQKRREVALKTYQLSKEKSIYRQNTQNNQLDNSKVTITNQNPERYDPPTPPTLKKDISLEYKRYVMQNSSNKFLKNTLKPQMSENASRMDYYSNQPQGQPNNEQSYRLLNNNQIEQQQLLQKYYQKNGEVNRPTKQQNGTNQQSQSRKQYFKNQYNADLMKKNQEYQRIQKYEQMSRKMTQNPRQIRKNNPTNLSLLFNVAGLSIVNS